MRKLLWVVLILAAAWAGYWAVGARGTESGLKAWFAARLAEGWQAEYSDLSTRGFPNRFDTTITDLALADPATGLAWQAPFFQIFALSYRPFHIIAVWPPEQTVASPWERIAVTTADMRASAVFEPGTDLRLDHSSLVIEELALTSSLGWQAAFEKGLLATRRTVARDDAYDIALEASGYVPPVQLRNALDPAGVLPNRVEGLKIDSTVAFDAPWDRFALERRRPQPTSLELKSLSAVWGRLTLRAAGTLEIDANGVPDGRISVRAENWREMLDLAVATGVVPQGLAPTLSRAMEFLAGLSGDPNAIDAPLSFQRGFVTFGPVPLGRAPRLSIR